MRARAPLLADMLPSRDNNLNAIRMIAASMVLVSHAYPIALGAGAPEPLLALTGTSLGHYAVVVFFAISGLLIARSFDRRDSMIRFVLARVLRLFPALVVALTLTVIVGAFFTSLPLADYLARRETWTYVPANLTLAFLQYPLPGVFDSNPYGPPINGSLWTLFYEVACYGGVVILGFVGILRLRAWALGVLAAVIVFHFAAPAMLAAGLPLPEAIRTRADAFALLTFPFMIGTCAYVWRDHIRLSGTAAALLWVPVMLLPAGQVMVGWIIVALSYSAFWIGYVPKGALLGYNRLGDYSYGVYIYAFPVQQAVAHLVPGVTPVANMALAFPATLLLGIVSWNLVEARALAAVGPLSNWLTRDQPQPLA